MTNTILNPKKAGRLTCTWVATGDAKTPLTCVWTQPKANSSAKEAPSPDSPGRMLRCA